MDNIDDVPTRKFSDSNDSNQKKNLIRIILESALSL